MKIFLFICLGDNPVGCKGESGGLQTNGQDKKRLMISQKTNLLSEQNESDLGGVWWANRNPEQNEAFLHLKPLEYWAKNEY